MKIAGAQSEPNLGTSARVDLRQKYHVVVTKNVATLSLIEVEKSKEFYFLFIFFCTAFQCIFIFYKNKTPNFGINLFSC